jgi:hypothetical protein
MNRILHSIQLMVFMALLSACYHPLGTLVVQIGKNIEEIAIHNAISDFSMPWLLFKIITNPSSFYY